MVGADLADLRVSSKRSTVRVLVAVLAVFLGVTGVVMLAGNRTHLMQQPQVDSTFVVPTSVSHANIMLGKFAGMNNELPSFSHKPLDTNDLKDVEKVARGLYERHVAPHIGTMYHHFLDELGSTAPHFRDGTTHSKTIHKLDREEFLRGTADFGDSVLDIIVNNLRSPSARFGINQFSDWTKDEKNRFLLAKPVVPTNFSRELQGHGDAHVAVQVRVSAGQCSTDNHNCAYWKSVGYCDSSSVYFPHMHANCACTCSNSGDCADSQSRLNCDYWKGLGYCAAGQKYYTYVSKNCKKTCGLCGGGGGGGGDGGDGVTSRNWAEMYPQAFDVRQQGQCGSCWAHSTVEMLRQMWTIKHLGADTGRLSVQYLVDCQPGADCHGGWPEASLKWIHDTGGVPTQAVYGQYMSRNQQCRPNVPKTVTTAGPMRLRGELDMRTHLIRDGSMGVVVYANNAWNSFAGGALSASDCANHNINHAVQLVGFDSRTLGGVWIIQNSWGTSWGVTRSRPYSHVLGKAGFILLKYGQDACKVSFAPVMARDVSRVQSFYSVAASRAMVEPPLPSANAQSLAIPANPS